MIGKTENVRMKVAMGTVYPSCESMIRGGVEAVAGYLTRALNKYDNIDLHIVSCNRSIARSFKEKRGSVTFHWLATGGSLYCARAITLDAWRVRKVYDQIRPDIIHAQGFSEYSLAARPDDCLLLTIHGVDQFAPAMMNARQFRGPVGVYRKLISQKIAQLSMRHASAVISIAGEYIPRLLARSLKRKRIYYIDNPISGEFFSRNSDSHPSEPIVLHAGSVIERKNILGLIGAFSNVTNVIPKAQLRIAGAIEDTEYYKRLRKEVALRKLGDRVLFLGPLDQRALIDVYSKASVFALSSIHETVPVVIAQAMAMGKPVVATDVAGTSWIVDDGKTGFLTPVGDMNGFADKIVELLSNRRKCQEMGRLAKKIAHERFAADVVAAKTIQVYQDMIRGRR